jgi:hypothetical protein
MTFLTERSHTILMSAKLGDKSSMYVPDDSGAFDQEQQDLTRAAKEAYGCTNAVQTFKIADKDEERNIYEPSVIAKDNKIMIEWGGEYTEVDPTMVIFDGYKPNLSSKSNDEVQPLKVRIRTIKPDEAKSKVQKAFSLLAKDDRGAFLNKAWSNGTIVELLMEGYPTVTKLKEVPAGKYEVVEFKMGGFDKYILRLADGTWIRANTAIQDKLSGYEMMDIKVSVDEPALLTVGVSTRTTSTGHPIIPVDLVSFRNVNLPVFDFS